MSGTNSDTTIAILDDSLVIRAGTVIVEVVEVSAVPVTVLAMIRYYEKKLSGGEL